MVIRINALNIRTSILLMVIQHAEVCIQQKLSPYLNV